jgi:hypothetical protein
MSEEKKEVVSLVRPIESEEEKKRLMEEAQKQIEKAQDLMEQMEEGEDGYLRVPLVQKAPVKQQKIEKSPEERDFLLLFSGTDENEDEFKHWDIVTGRTAAYDAIVAMLENEGSYFDLVESKIVVEVETIKEMKSMYDFLAYVAEQDLLHRDRYLDVEEYVGDVVAEDEEE